jgi:hypothetical protein
VPDDPADTCAGKCGDVTNNCGQTVDCTARCTGCCAGDTCHIEDNAACGTGGGSCTNCLSSNSLCRSGTCQACDVCQTVGACAFTSVQAAINATSPQLSTILICPGTYVENAGDGSSAVRIVRSLSLIGAGDGADAATNTILRPQLADRSVVLVPGSSGNPTVAFEGLRITGGSDVSGRGINLGNSCVVSITDCTITDNHTGVNGAGINLVAQVQLTLTNTHVTANTANSFGGGGIDASGTNNVVTLDADSRVTVNSAVSAGGGIFASPGTVNLPSVDNVTDNSPNDCAGPGPFNGPGAICTTT